METGAYLVHENENNSRDIIFSIKPDFQNKIPELQQKLHLEVEKALVVIQMLFEEDDKSFKMFFDQLLSLAQAGLVGDNAQPTIALNALLQFKSELVDKKSGEVKNHYFKTLGIKSFNLGIFPVSVSLAIIILHYYFPLSKELEKLNVISNFLLIWGSCMLGVWLSFGARKTILKFEDLNILEEDRLEPTMRLLFAGAITMVFSLLFYTKAISVEIGNVSLTTIGEDPVIAIIFGTMFGLSEQILGKKITKKAASIFENQ